MYCCVNCKLVKRDILYHIELENRPVYCEFELDNTSLFVCQIDMTSSKHFMLNLIRSLVHLSILQNHPSLCNIPIMFVFANLMASIRNLEPYLERKKRSLFWYD